MSSFPTGVQQFYSWSYSAEKEKEKKRWPYTPVVSVNHLNAMLTVGDDNFNRERGADRSLDSTAGKRNWIVKWAGALYIL